MQIFWQQVAWQTWPVGVAGIVSGAVLIISGWRWFGAEERIGGQRDPQSSVLALRSAAHLILAGIVLLILSFIYLWAMDLIRIALKISRG